jgi:hypothetical protein
MWFQAQRLKQTSDLGNPNDRRMGGDTNNIWMVIAGDFPTGGTTATGVDGLNGERLATRRFERQAIAGHGNSYGCHLFPHPIVTGKDQCMGQCPVADKGPEQPDGV